MSAPSAPGSTPPGQPLRALLRASAALPLAMAVAHLTGTKRPGLFIYSDVPSNAYQDKIIGVVLIPLAALFLAAARDRGVLPLLLFSVWAVVAGLAHINASSALRAMLGDGATQWYWVQTGALAALAATVTWLAFRDRRRA